MADPLLIAKNGGIECFLLPGLANRHGLITGATGTGKTVTLQKLAEQFSASFYGISFKPFSLFKMHWSA